LVLLRNGLKKHYNVAHDLAMDTTFACRGKIWLEDLKSWRVREDEGFAVYRQGAGDPGE
jgi:hypothetical protein